MSWVEEFVNQAMLAAVGTELDQQYHDHLAERTHHDGLPDRVRVWLENARLIQFSDADAQRRFESAAASIDVVLTRGGSRLGQISDDVIGSAAQAVRSNTQTYLQGKKEKDLCRALLALLDGYRKANEDDWVEEKTLQRDLGMPLGKVQRLVDWAEGKDFIKQNVGTNLGGRTMQISWQGLEQLEDAQTNAVASTVAAAPTTILPLWTLDISFISDIDVREVLERNVHELAQAQSAHLHTAAIVLAGAIGEGVLFDALVARKTRAMAAVCAPKKAGVPKDIETEEWKLVEYINVASELGILAPSTAKMAHEVLRQFRNMIHPKVQVRVGLKPDEAEMKGSVAWLEALVRDVRKAP